MPKHIDTTVTEDAFTRAGIETWLFAGPKHRAEPPVQFATPEWAVRGLRVFA